MDLLLRLSHNGTSKLSYTSGRVQLLYNSTWWNICNDDTFGMTEATVICHQLGYTGASSYSRARDDSYEIYNYTKYEIIISRPCVRSDKTDIFSLDLD